MSLKSKGMNAERDLIHLFWGGGWASVRVAGSGSMRYPSADILATNKIRILAIECKTCIKESKYIPQEDIEQLKTFSEMFSAEPWIAIKFKGHEWYFVSLEDLETTNKSYMINLGLVKSKGLLFEEIISK